MDLSQCNVVITGASRGLGRALAEELGERGARLALIAREGERLERLAEALRTTGRDVHAFAADLGDKAAIHPLAARIQALLGPVDLLVHNASTLGPTKLALLADTDCEDFARALEVNLLGPFRLTKALLPAMLLRGRGTLLHVSSDAAVNAYPRWGAYGASKAALEHLSRTWAAELAGTGVRSNALDPGEMDTDMHRAAMPDADPATLARPREVARHIARLLARGDLPARFAVSEVQP